MEMKEVIRRFIQENMIIYEENVTFTDDDNIFEKGFVDSLFAIKLVTFIEKEFSIKVDNDDLELSNFNSLNNIVAFINVKR